jgi:hypothetical protein
MASVQNWRLPSFSFSISRTAITTPSALVERSVY